LDESDVETVNDNEDVTPSQRLASFPSNFRVMYIGQDVPDSCKHLIFSKISESLSQIFWEEAEDTIPTNDIGLEKRLVIYPVYPSPSSSSPGAVKNEDGKFQVDWYQDSGVAICEADLTNGPFSKALEYLQKTFAKADQDSNLVDLCIVFVPQDVERFPFELLSTMKKLQEKVALLPIIILKKQDLFRDEMEEKRQAIVKLIEDNGIKIFIWKADQLIEDRDCNGEPNSKWVETVYTKKVSTVEEFTSFDNQAIYEDLQSLRSRAIEFRKDRLHKERAKKRRQNCDKLAGILRDFIIMCMVLYTFYLFAASVWNYAEWSVIPPDLASSLQAVSRASQNQNVLRTIPLDNGETQPLIDVSQESSSRFLFNISNKKQYFGNHFEVIVTHNPPQILGRYDVQEIGNGRYRFDIDTTGSKGEVLVEIKEKNGSSIKTVTWVPKEDKTKSNAIKEHKEEPTFLKSVQNTAADAYQVAVFYSTYAYEEAMVFGASLIDEIHRNTIYFGHQLSNFYDWVWDSINYWIPIIQEKILNSKTIVEESIEEGYLNLKEGALNFARFVKDQYEERFSLFE
jgi:hypothetical protein